MTPAIRVEQLSKKYLISHQKRERYTSLRDVLASQARRWLRNPFTVLRKPTEANDLSREEFWALKDVSFEIKQGERVGIIGHNGAGKSTLLKVLSRITEPSSGRISLKGRVASLLEVGTGFHPELTGRENIFLNGAILGMRKAEIKRKFDEIVNFADVEKFLDTPVKRYSSGMYVRLAFAVAAHLEPEILLVDEILAVGDGDFQKKSLGKMEKIGQEGRTVIFVSHNMNSILRLTEKTIALQHGRILAYGQTEEAVDQYLSSLNSPEISSKMVGNVDWLELERFSYDEPTSQRGFNQPLHFNASITLRESANELIFMLGIANTTGARIITAKGQLQELSQGYHRLTLTIGEHRLVPGNYSIRFRIWRKSELLFDKDHILSIELLTDHIDDPLLVPLVAEGRDRYGCYCPINISEA